MKVILGGCVTEDSWRILGMLVGDDNWWICVSFSRGEIVVMGGEDCS